MNGDRLAGQSRDARQRATDPTAGPTPDTRQRVMIHGHLRDRLMSWRAAGGDDIRQRHVLDAAVELSGVTFRVQPGLLAKIRATNRRKVCAWAVGTVSGVERVTVDRWATDPGWSRVTFNPYRGDTFTGPDGSPVLAAGRVVAVAVAGSSARTRLEVYMETKPTSERDS